MIGLGSGRCGTVSLAHLIDAQPHTSVTHEFCPMPWEFDPAIWNWNIGRLMNRELYPNPIVCDVGFYWLNHIPRLVDTFSGVRCICLKRDRQETIDSYMRRSGGLGQHQTDDWFRLFPDYDADPQDAVGMMWDEYYQTAERWVGDYPDQFRILDMDYALNTEEGVGETLSHVGIPQSEWIVQTGIRLNQTASQQAFRVPRAIRAIARSGIAPRL